MEIPIRGETLSGYIYSVGIARTYTPTKTQTTYKYVRKWQRGNCANSSTKKNPDCTWSIVATICVSINRRGKLSGALYTIC